MLSKLQALTFAATLIASASATPTSAMTNRQDVCEGVPTVSCTFVVVPSGAPSPSAALWSEWNFLIGKTFAESLQAPEGEITPVCGGKVEISSTVTGPATDGAYVVIGKDVGSPGLTAVQSTAILTAFAATTLAGPWSGVSWDIQNVTC